MMARMILVELDATSLLPYDISYVLHLAWVYDLASVVLTGPWTRGP